MRFTLVSDGSSDQVLLYPLRWLLRQHGIRTPMGEWADLRNRRKPPKTLQERIIMAVDDYPCDLLFVHRDAERESREKRLEEITKALKEAGLAVPAVCVIPVRMQETWLLIDEMALRQAAANPNGRVTLSMPAIQRLELLPDPKTVLHELLVTASELQGRRRQKFRPTQQSIRLGELIDDYAPLRQLSAFAALEKALLKVLEAHGLG